MRELRFEGLSDDGNRLVLLGKDGQRWSVVIDERVEAAVRRDRARLGQVEIEQSGQLRPREIQARIRAGATAEDVAAASGLPLESIRRFEGPVLTQRAWIAQQAAAVVLRRQGGDTALGELVTARLAEQGVEAEDITWDAWRPDEGPWTVIATFPLGPNTHVATWAYDQTTRTVNAVDDNAEDLTAAAAPAKLRLVATRPQLAAVSAGAPSAGAPSAGAPSAGDDADDPVAAQPEPAIDIPAAAQPGPADLGLAAAGSEQDEDKAQAEEQPTAATGPTPRSIHRSTKRATRHPSGTQLPGKGSPANDPAPADVAAEPTPAEPSDALFESDTPATAKPKAGRSAVPSFDDILFGPAPKH